MGPAPMGPGGALLAGVAKGEADGAMGAPPGALFASCPIDMPSIVGALFATRAGAAADAVFAGGCDGDGVNTGTAAFAAAVDGSLGLPGGAVLAALVDDAAPKGPIMPSMVALRLLTRLGSADVELSLGAGTLGAGAFAGKFAGGGAGALVCGAANAPIIVRA